MFADSVSGFPEKLETMRSPSGKGRILIVDDEPSNIRILVDTLKADCVILLATSGEKALKIAFSEDPPDLILLDVMMPGMDGYEVCRRLKSDPHTRDIPVIFATARGNVEDEAHGLELGAVDYIVKPFQLSIVRARVRAHLELKLQRDELERMARHLEQLNQTKNKFLGMAAHDLRNPLVSILGFSELLLSDDSDPLDETQRLYLETIYSASEGMLDLVNDLLDVSVIESGNLTLRPEPASFNEMLKQKLIMNEVVAGKKGITIHASIEKELKGRFDYKRLGQVLDNLMSNAIKYSPPGSDISVSLDVVEGGARISIRDAGPGISQKDHAKLFGEFQKLSARPTAGEKSTGLGLAIVKKIVEAHGGTLEVFNNPEKGSTFSFVIPITGA